MTWVLIIGLLMNAVALPLAARRVWFLYRVVSSGQPAPDRIAGVTGRIGTAVKRQLVEVFGQRKMLKWTVPGTAHFFVMWAFFILATVYLEAYVVLLARDPGWNWFVFGNWAVLGFLQDFIAVMCTLGIVVFWAIRLRNQPKEMGRKSRFFGSHLGPAYFTLFMIFNVVWTLFLFRGAVEARDMALSAAGAGDHGYGKAAFVSYLLGKVLPDSTWLIGIGLILHIGVMLVFLLFVLNSKHLHIFIAPINVLFGRYPVALGAAKPLMSEGKRITLDDIDDLDEDTKLGVGAPEDFSWKGILDFETCTECGRCQSQCPAWNTEKPLSPKLMIMALRDATLAKAPYLLAPEDKREALAEGNATLTKELERPLVGDTGDEWFYMPEDGSGVIDPDVLWSCVTCGACVQQCPVDIEHVDHIVDMRRYQVLVESNFPAELNQLFKGMENKGNPWNMSPKMRMDWAKGLEFDVPVVGEDLESLESVDWLFWVGCAGAYEDRAKKTTRAVAELLNIAGVSFGVLGNGETCTGDSARRAGNEFLFQGLAQQNIETFKEYKVKKVVSTCAHCFNTLRNEYKEFGIELEVVHHTQLLNRLVREGKLTPVKDGAGAAKRSITYHDPCYLGRHNQVYAPPRELLQVLPGAEFVEMERNSERSFCCGAGGARMWMEETIGTRINDNRTAEAVGTGADQIAVGCPFCRVMLSDGLTAAQANGTAREEVEVLDVAQMLLASVKGESATKAKKAAAPGKSAPPAALEETADVKTAEAEEAPSSAEAAKSDQDEPATESAAGTASGGAAGGSLFDLGGDSEPDEKPAAATDDSDASATTASGEAETESGQTSSDASTKPTEDLGSGGSLFDLGGESEPATSGEPDTESADDKVQDAPPAEQSTDASTKPAEDLGSGGSLFDLGGESEPATSGEPDTESADDKVQDAPPAKEPTQESAPASAPASEIPEGGSLFDLEAPAAPEKPAARATSDTDAEQAEPGEAAESDEPAAEPGTSGGTETESTDDQAQDAPAAEGLAGGAALSAAATFAASDDPEAEAAESSPEEPADDPETILDADDSDAVTDAEPKSEPESADAAEEPTAALEDTEDSEATEDSTEEKPKPTSSGEAHQPKTDVDLNESGSLFDL